MINNLNLLFDDRKLAAIFVILTLVCVSFAGFSSFSAA
jgi:hypothetical protein